LASSLDAGPHDRDVEAALGANMALRRRAVERAGDFDEWIVIGGADTEWFDRLGAAGGRTMYIADAWLWHRRSERRLRLPALVAAEFRRGVAAHRYLIRLGRRDIWRSSLRDAPALLVHAARARCRGGLAMAARSCGYAYGLVRHRRLTAPPSPEPRTVQR
jgi:GT2 family glycosyltransferase